MQATNAQYIFISASADDFLTLNNNVRLPFATRLPPFDIGGTLDESLHLIDCILEWHGLLSRTTLKFRLIADLVYGGIMTRVFALQSRFPGVTVVDEADKLKRTLTALKESSSESSGGSNSLRYTRNTPDTDPLALPPIVQLLIQRCMRYLTVFSTRCLQLHICAETQLTSDSL